MATEQKRTTAFDSYSTNQVKTLEDLFNLESKLTKQLAELKKKLNSGLANDVKQLTQKQIEDTRKAYEELIADIAKEASDAVDKQEKDRLKRIAEDRAIYKEQLSRLQQQGKISDKQIDKQTKAKEKAQKIEDKNRDKRLKIQGQQDLIRAKQESKSLRRSMLEDSKYVFGGVGSLGDQFAASMAKVGENFGKSVGKAFNDISNKINSAMDTYSKYQSSIDTRIQGAVDSSGKAKSFSGMEKALKSAVGASPYLKTETMLSNLQTLVEAGISTNVEQRAFLNTIKDKVAATFDAANSSLLRIIRLQQNDSTAARLGMEAYLTHFLNEMVDNTEYLNQTFDSVQSALLEASAIMTTQSSTAFEYQVQKWLGVLVGRGMSENTANNIAAAIGMLGSGNVSGLSGNSMNNLLVMAASRAGLDYADLLTGGLDASKTNTLMEYIVKYMQEINNSGNKVVRSQYAQTFGLNISDLMAATGMTSQEITDVYKDNQTYDSMFAELGKQLNKVSSRTHISEKMLNLFDNAQFSLATNIAGNPVLASMWKVTDMIQGVTGGITIPALSYLGTMVDLEATVENLIKLGLVGAGSLGMIGDVVTGLVNSGGNFSNVLNRLSITGSATNDITSRIRAGYTGSSAGRGLRARTSGLSSSMTSDLVSNSAGEDIESQTLNSAMDDSKSKLAEQAEESDNPTADLRTYFLDVFDVKFSNLLAMVAHNGGYDGLFSTSAETIKINKDTSVVRTTYSVNGEDSDNLVSNISKNINDNVEKIYSLLVAGITVNLAGSETATMPGLTNSILG